MTHSQIEFDINNCLDIVSKYTYTKDVNGKIQVDKNDLKNLKNYLNEIRSQLVILKEY